MKLTEARINEALKAGRGVAGGELVDGQEPGLRLKIGKSDARWSVLARGPDGERIRMPIGNWPTVDLDTARGQARRLKLAMERPQEPDDASLSVGRLLELYDKRRLSQLKKGKVIRRALDAALSGLRRREVASLTRRDISAAVDAVADRAPIHANRMLAYAKAFFGWAVGRGYLESNPAAGISKPTREITRERTPTLSELVEIWRATEGLGYPFGPVIQLLILTAARRDEIGGMRAAELDLAEDCAEGCWTLPANRSKNGRAIRMPLSAKATAILTKALKDRGREGAFVFTTTGATPVSGWSRAKSRIDAAIATARAQAGVNEEMEAWRFHDLRRSFATHACDLLQVDPAVADRCLNHVGAATTSTVSRIYARNEMYAQRRAALTAWARLLEQALDSRQRADKANPAATETNQASEADCKGDPIGMGYDIIGDVHGHADRLEALLKALGYAEHRGSWRHPARQAIFVGDLIDRGPGQLRTLRLVRAMIDSGSARAVMGNHEFNAIAFATPDPENDGSHLRPRGKKNRDQHQAFLADVGEDSPEHQAWVNWFLELLVWIEEPAFRVVHACWSPRHIEWLGPQLRSGMRLTPKLVQAASRRGSEAYGAIETILKGVEVRLPAGVTFADKEGVRREAIRTRWWNPNLTTYRNAYIGPMGVEMPDLPIVDYEAIPEPDRPTFVGHYWFEADAVIAPAARRVACVDYSVAKGGPMVAYRFDGEQELLAAKFVAV